MTPNAKLTPIKDISPMVMNMRIRGRVISKWHAHKLNQAHDPYSLELVLQDEEGDRNPVTENGGKLPLLPHAWKVSFYKNTNVTRVDQIDDNLIGFRNEPFTRILDTNEEYEENNSVGIGDVVAVNSIGARKIQIIVIEDEEYKGREGYDANEHKIQLVAHETKIVTPREFMHGAVKKLVGSICETEHCNGLNAVKIQETECVIYASIHSIQYESGWTYIGCKICSKKVVPLASKEPSSSKTKQTWWCEKHESQDQVASRYKMIVRVMDESESAQLCNFDGSMYKMSGYTAWELVEKHAADTATYFPDELNCIIGKKFLFRVKFTEYNHKNNNYEESEEDSEDELTTPAVPIKTKKVLDLSLTRRLQLTSPSTCNIGSLSGQSSRSGKKRSRTIERSIVVIDLSDSEYDTEDDDKSPNSKKPFVVVDEEPASQKAIVRVKLEKNLEKDVEKDLDKNVEKDVENDEEPK
ncbi:replication protein A 70 kDa DNA-binding subunit B [Tanacetum coccineum]|uniref:Replication protein A 70 kDa DNA-binding subunit B n=1 Tax=Tanacetum coccineum TaxID=301880 RepID=A0ABQ5CPR2_9ASTR